MVKAQPYFLIAQRSGRFQNDDDIICMMDTRVRSGNRQVVFTVAYVIMTRPEAELVRDALRVSPSAILQRSRYLKRTKCATISFLIDQPGVLQHILITCNMCVQDMGHSTVIYKDYKYCSACAIACLATIGKMVASMHVVITENQRPRAEELVLVLHRACPLTEIVDLRRTVINYYSFCIVLQCLILFQRECFTVYTHM